jgi:hypothetical protein
LDGLFIRHAIGLRSATGGEWVSISLALLRFDAIFLMERLVSELRISGSVNAMYRNKLPE